MKIPVLALAAILLVCSSAEAQRPMPEGASDFFKELGGLSFSRNKVHLLQRIAGNTEALMFVAIGDRSTF